MKLIYVSDLQTWRQHAKLLLAENIPPHLIAWQEPQASQQSLFNEVNDIARNNCNIIPTTTISKRFLSLAEKVACHRDIKKWMLLYNAFWRIKQGETHLLNMASDATVHQLLLMEKAVSRDAHKMKAFVRFKLYEHQSEQHYIAWHKPDHKIVELVAPFFQRRFNVMRWTILTPDASVHWDGQQLHFGKGVINFQSHMDDPIENLWLTFYQAIFNPGRIKIKAMKREMPVRHWPTLPETRLIPFMLQEAEQRVATMLKTTEGFADVNIPTAATLAELATAAKKCSHCSLYKCAKQTVFGSGNANAKIMLVGEQPGEMEDQYGTAFIGPAGKVLDRALSEAGIVRENIYLTNAVKHFKFILQNHKRLHQSPNKHEINACKRWLEAEIKLIQPRLIICLGLTAARALIGYGFALKEKRGQWFNFSATQFIMLTYHPSAVLRVPDVEQQQIIYNNLVSDLKNTVRKLNN